METHGGSSLGARGTRVVETIKIAMKNTATLPHIKWMLTCFDVNEIVAKNQTTTRPSITTAKSVKSLASLQISLSLSEGYGFIELTFGYYFVIIISLCR